MRAFLELHVTILEGGNLSEEVAQWFDAMLTGVALDKNHPARPWFGLPNRGRAAERKALDYLRYIVAVRARGYTLDAALSHAAKAFRRSKSRIDKATRGPLRQKPHKLFVKASTAWLRESGLPAPARVARKGSKGHKATRH